MRGSTVADVMSHCHLFYLHWHLPIDRFADWVIVDVPRY